MNKLEHAFMKEIKEINFITDDEKQNIEDMLETKEYNKLSQSIKRLQQSYKQQLSNQELLDYFNKIQRVSNLLEEFLRNQQELFDLIGSIKKLRNDWKKLNMEDIILSILKSMNSKDFNIIKVTKSQLAFLGLNSNSIGKYYIVFDHQTSDQQQRSVLNQLVSDFNLIFKQNEDQNLSIIQQLFEREKQLDLFDEVQTLHQTLFHKSLDIQSQPANLQFDLNTNPNLNSLLKFKRSRSKHYSYYSNNSKTSQLGLYSISLSKLSQEFLKISQDYYSNLFVHVRSIYYQKSLLVEFYTHTLMKISNAIQLQKGCANLNKSLILLSKIIHHTHLL